MQDYMLPFVLVTLVASITPGPNNITAMTLGQQFGFKRTLTFVLGVGIGWLAILMICNLVNALLMQIMPVIEIPLRILGALYMLYLAYKVITSKPAESHEQKSWRTSVWAGFLMQFINPKGILFALSISASSIVPHSSNTLEMLLHSLVMVAVAMPCVSCWAGFGALFQKIFKKYTLPINIIMTVLLVYCAVMLSGILG